MVLWKSAQFLDSATMLYGTVLDKGSRHMEVCHAAQENRVRANYYINRNNKVAIFHAFVTPCSFIQRTPKLLWRCLPTKGNYTPNLKKITFPRYEWANFQVFSSFFFLVRLFAHLKNHCNSQTRSPIQLKFGTLVGCPEAIIIINFGENPYKVLRVIINHLRKTIFRHAYRVNCWLDQPENQFVARFNIRGCLLVVRNEWGWRQQRYEAKLNLDKNCAIDFCVKENHELQPLSDKPHGGNHAVIIEYPS